MIFQALPVIVKLALVPLFAIIFRKEDFADFESFEDPVAKTMDFEVFATVSLSDPPVDGVEESFKTRYIVDSFWML